MPTFSLGVVPSGGGDDNLDLVLVVDEVRRPIMCYSTRYTERGSCKSAFLPVVGIHKLPLV